jgi:cell division transport system permease protein
MFSSAVNQCKSVIRSTWLGLRQDAAVASLSVGIIALSLTALGAFGLVLGSIQEVSNTWKRPLAVTFFLRPDASARDAERLRQRAEQTQSVRAAHFISRDMARARLGQALGERAALLSGMDDHVIPTAVEVELHPSATAQTAEELSRALSGDGAVEDAAWGAEELERLSAVKGLMQWAVILLGGLIALVTILVISSTLKLTLLSRREEIAIMMLVGASNAFVRAPFLLEGAMQGLLGAVTAGGLLAGLHQALALEVARVLSQAFGPVPVMESPLNVVGWLLLLGVSLGVMGGFLGTARLLKV